MISLDQVYLLEQKVESAVAKIQQLQAENDALRNKCAELTNALSSKSEQLSSFENDQSLIENGIKKALDRLNYIENTVINSVSGNSVVQGFSVQKPVITQNAQIEQTISNQINNTHQQTKETPANDENILSSASIGVINNTVPSFNNMETVPVENTIVQEDANQNQESESSVFNENLFNGFTSQEDTQSFDSMDSMDESEPESEDSDGLGFDIF